MGPGKGDTRIAITTYLPSSVLWSSTETGLLVSWGFNFDSGAFWSYAIGYKNSDSPDIRPVVPNLQTYLQVRKVIVLLLRLMGSIRGVYILVMGILV